ncbi:MAG: (2Fe-2S)-binding protein [Candidatus Wallbacteria bacterium]|nr:(2Fe-2S)-binding protein [Candidatus Wallbacteria bacterium]
MRIDNHPILDFKLGKRVTFFFNNEPLEGIEGEAVTSALHANGIKVLSHSLRLGRKRGLFCAIGKCASCLMRVNGQDNVRVCILPLAEGMQIEMQSGVGELK